MSDYEKRPGRAPNRLINEQSPYLRQHAYNPVDWYPWGEEALSRARLENKPILLSIGYSACHWCHVMERESFENEEIARLMNENFVAVKVDREERPDLDQIYMEAVQMLAGRGGWPLNVFLTPEGQPFYGGTYFPPVDRQGMPGFAQVLKTVAGGYRDGAKEIYRNVEKLAQALAARGAYSAPPGGIERDLPQTAARSVAQAYDSVNGGVGQAPKFPNTFAFSLFLRAYDASGDYSFAEKVHQTLARMARGGIYDQLGGGFHRYSVDEKWLVPHFEKMLYDNALLSRLYLDAARDLNEPGFLSVARETLNYVLREMSSPEGGFYCSQDADSEDEEGRFFLWTPEEIDAALGEKLGPIAQLYFGVSEEGNFEGKSVLHRTVDIAEAAGVFQMPPAEMAEAIATIRRTLFAEREKRVKPARDDKILAAWNGMMLSACAEGYRVLREPHYLDAARKTAEFVMARLWDGRTLKRSFKDGVARFNGYLEDYALVANALIDLYEATLDGRYLAQARTLADAILERFVDRERGGFFFTSDDHEKLVARFKATFDASMPSASSAAVMALLRLHAYTGEDRYLNEAQRAIKLFADFMKKLPLAFAHMLEALDLYIRGPAEVVLVGDRDSAEFHDWVERLGRLYIPNLAIYHVDPHAPEAGFLPEPARGKPQVNAGFTVYLCRERACSPPITSFGDLEAELEN